MSKEVAFGVKVIWETYFQDDVSRFMEGVNND